MYKKQNTIRGDFGHLDTCIKLVEYIHPPNSALVVVAEVGLTRLGHGHQQLGHGHCPPGALPVHAAHSVGCEPRHQYGGPDSVGLAFVLLQLLVLPAPQLGRSALEVPPPRRLDVGGCPRAPLLGVEPERVLHRLAVHPAELPRHELELLGVQREGLHLRERHDGARGRRQAGAGLGVERPREQLLPAEVALLEQAAVVEPRAAAVGGDALEAAADDEDHLVDGVALPGDVGVLRAQAGLEALADGVQEALVHVGEERHPADEAEAEVALDVAAEVLGQVLHQRLLVDAVGVEPLVLVVAADALAQLRRQQPVVHPLLRVALLHAHLLQAHGEGLEIGLDVADEHGHEDEAEDGERDGEERLPGVDAGLEPLPEGAQVGQPPPEAEEQLGGGVLGLEHVRHDGRRVDAVVEGDAAVPLGLARLVDHLPGDGAPLQEPQLPVVAAVHVDLVAPGELVARVPPAVADPLDGQQVPEGADDVAGQHVPEEVVGGAGVGGLGEDAAGALELRGDGVDAHHARDVLDEDDEEQAVLGVQHGGALGPVQELPDDHLGQREHGHEVRGEEAAHVAAGDERGVDHELAAPEHPGGRLDVGGAELQRDAAQEEEVHHAAHDGGGDGEPAVDAHAQVALVGDHGQVEEHGVHGDGHDAGDEEGAVEAHQHRVLRVEDAPGGVLEVLLEHGRHGGAGPERPPDGAQLRRAVRDDAAGQRLRRHEPPPRRADAGAGADAHVVDLESRLVVRHPASSCRRRRRRQIGT
jgi:hypothetical protein